MNSDAFDDFIDDCFISKDDICKFEIYKSRKYENRKNHIASQIISRIKEDEKLIESINTGDQIKR